MLGDPLGVTSAFRLAAPAEREALELAGGRVQRPMGVHTLEMPERVEQGGQIARGLVGLPLRGVHGGVVGLRVKGCCEGCLKNFIVTVVVTIGPADTMQYQCDSMRCFVTGTLRPDTVRKS